MRGLKELTLVGIKLYVREPMAAFFTLIFGPMILLLFALIYGNDPTPFFGGYGMVDVSVPAYAGMIIASVGLLGIGINTASQREYGVLRRFQATPLHPLTYLGADVFVSFLLTLLGFLILIAEGKLIWDLRFDGNPVSVLVGFTLSALAFFALGYLIASLSPTARVAQVVGMVLFYPMLFLSGAAIPLEVLPQNILRWSRFLPLTYVVTLMRGLWAGDGWSQHLVEAGVLVGMLVIGAPLSARLFRWE
jgi:ABC-2 type transport system permease protein